MKRKIFVALVSAWGVLFIWTVPIMAMEVTSMEEAEHAPLCIANACAEAGIEVSKQKSKGSSCLPNWITWTPISIPPEEGLEKAKNP